MVMKKNTNFHFNIILCGFMGCGKTTVGRQLALQSGLQLIDTDYCIETEVGLSVSQIFATYGEAHFRELEKNCIKKASAAPTPVIISSGGGSILNIENIVNLKKSGKIFLLYAPLDTIISRLGTSTTATRPLIPNKSSIYELFFSRREKYLQAADFIISADKSVSAICSEILDLAKIQTEQKN